MCHDRSIQVNSAAEKLALIFTRYVSGPGSFTAANVRYMLEKDWGKVSVLAHTVHDEQKEQRAMIERVERAELARLKAKYEL